MVPVRTSPLRALVAARDVQSIQKSRRVNSFSRKIFRRGEFSFRGGVSRAAENSLLRPQTRMNTGSAGDRFHEAMCPALRPEAGKIFAVPARFRGPDGKKFPHFGPDVRVCRDTPSAAASNHASPAKPDEYRICGRSGIKSINQRVRFPSGRISVRRFEGRQGISEKHMDDARHSSSARPHK